MPLYSPSIFFFLNDPATPEISPLSLHDALPISDDRVGPRRSTPRPQTTEGRPAGAGMWQGACRHQDRRGAFAPRAARAEIPRADHVAGQRSEEHTSELQSRLHLVCRLLLEKKKK